MKEIKAVIDTNVFISALLCKGKTSHKIYKSFIDGKFTPVISLAIFEEIVDVISRPSLNKLFNANEVERLKDLIKTDAIFVLPRQKVRVCRDDKDNIIIEAAITAKADCIVSGDNDLLMLNQYCGIPIISPGKFLKMLE